MKHTTAVEQYGVGKGEEGITLTGCLDRVRRTTFTGAMPCRTPLNKGHTFK
jgi:hypothetical protein